MSTAGKLQNCVLDRLSPTGSPGRSGQNGVCSGGQRRDLAHQAACTRPGETQPANLELLLPARNAKVEAVLWAGESLAQSKKDGEQRGKSVLMYKGQNSFLFEERLHCKETGKPGCGINCIWERPHTDQKTQK